MRVLSVARAGRQVEPHIGVLDVTQQHRVAQQDCGEDAERARRPRYRRQVLGASVIEPTRRQPVGQRRGVRRTGRAAHGDIRRQAPDQGYAARPPPVEHGRPPAARASPHRPPRAAGRYSASPSGTRASTARPRSRIAPLAAHQTVRVLAGRQPGEPQRAIGCQQRQRQFRSAGRGPAAGGIAVETQHRRRREPPQLLKLLLGQRRAEWRDGATDAGLREGDDVHVAFDHHQAARRPRTASRARSSA